MKIISAEILKQLETLCLELAKELETGIHVEINAINNIANTNCDIKLTMKLK
jgi:hypothetical protein